MEQYRLQEATSPPCTPKDNSPSASSGRLSWTSLVLSILLLANGGLLTAWTTAVRAPAEDSPEVGFARTMIAHHEQAVEMAEILHERSTDAELRQLTLDILLTQQAQIGQMQGWLVVWGARLRGTQPAMSGHGQRVGMASQAEVNALRVLPLAEAEISFLQLMVRHHQGGVVMAQAALAQIERPEVEQVAASVISSQKSEIGYMQALLAQRGAAPFSPLPGYGE